MTKLEEIARALAELTPRDTFHYTYDQNPGEYHEIAIAAVRALREPTTDMVDDMNDVVIDDPEYGPFHPSMEDCGEIWRKGIDSILADTEEGT